MARRLNPRQRHDDTGRAAEPAEPFILSPGCGRLRCLQGRTPAPFWACLPQTPGMSTAPRRRRARRRSCKAERKHRRGWRFGPQGGAGSLLCGGAIAPAAALRRAGRVPAGGGRDDETGAGAGRRKKARFGATRRDQGAAGRLCRPAAPCCHAYGQTLSSGACQRLHLLHGPGPTRRDPSHPSATHQEGR